MFDAEALSNILYDFGRSTPDVQASVIVDSDGLIMASQLPSSYEEDSVAAMSAALLRLGERTIEEIRGGNLEQILVKGDMAVIVLMSIGKEAVLCVMADKNVKLGLLFMSMKKSIEQLKKIM